MFARTARLLLRHGWPEDTPALAEALGEAAVSSRLTQVPTPYGLADAEAYLARPQPPDRPQLLIFERSATAIRLVGGIALRAFEGDRCTLGYWIRGDRRGRGYATEAGLAMVEIADALRIPRIEAHHLLDNPASGAVLAKLGFRQKGEVALDLVHGHRAPCRMLVRDQRAQVWVQPLAA